MGSVQKDQQKQSESHGRKEESRAGPEEHLQGSGEGLKVKVLHLPVWLLGGARGVRGTRRVRPVIGHSPGVRALLP